MSFLEKITVLILTYDEAPNIGRTLDALTRFPDVLVLDSGSGDGTMDIAQRYANIRCETRRFDTHAVQWNYGLLACGDARPWVLALDADYVLPPSLVDEIALLQPDAAISAYRVGFRYCVFGRALSATLYPPITALYRRDRTRYIQQGHTQRVVVDGVVADLRGRIRHDDRKSISRWFSSQQKYAKLEADYLLSVPRADLRRVDALRLMAWPAPLLSFVYTLIAKRAIFDGWAGWLYALQRMLAEMMVAIELVDRRLRASSVQPLPNVQNGERGRKAVMNEAAIRHRDSDIEAREKS